jgi:alpha-L-fucosidase
LAEWEALGYGMFIHFGMSTFTGYEFGQFSAQAKDYAPTALDVDQWIRVAHDGGMKYAILTTKHCYGHALWDSRHTAYDVKAGPVKTDVVRAFVDACRKYGLKPGFYYLLGWDKVNQWARTPEDYEAFCRAQIEELLTGYGPIAELWLDIPWDMGPDTDKVLARLYGRIKSLQPDCLVLQSGLRRRQRREMPPTYAHQEYGARRSSCGRRTSTTERSRLRPPRATSRGSPSWGRPTTCRWRSVTRSPIIGSGRPGTRSSP